MERKRKGSRISVAFPSCLSALDCEAPPRPPCNRVIIQRRETEQQQQSREEQQMISTEQQLTREVFATKRESLADENFSCSTAQVPLGGEGE